MFYDTFGETMFQMINNILIIYLAIPDIHFSTTFWILILVDNNQ